jgi:hypothetical protein
MKNSITFSKYETVININKKYTIAVEEETRITRALGKATCKKEE